MCVVGAATRVDGELDRLLGVGLRRRRCLRHRRHAQRQVEGRAAGGRIDRIDIISKFFPTARPAQVPGPGNTIVTFFEPPGMMHAICVTATRGCHYPPRAPVFPPRIVLVIRASAALIVRPTIISIRPFVTQTLPHVTLLRLECADQSDDLRRQSQLPVRRDGARCCGHRNSAGSLGDLGQFAVLKKNCSLADLYGGPRRRRRG